MTFNDYPEFKIVDIFSENDFSPNSQALSNLHVDVILNNQELSIKFKYNKNYIIVRILKSGNGISRFTIFVERCSKWSNISN